MKTKCPVCNIRDTLLDEYGDETICKECATSLGMTSVQKKTRIENYPKAFYESTLTRWNPSFITELKQDSLNYSINICIKGDSFTGKTSLACGILQELEYLYAHKKCLYINTQLFFMECKSMMDTSDSISYKISQLNEYDVICFDGVKSDLTPYETNLLDLIISSRTDNKLQTVLTVTDVVGSSFQLENKIQNTFLVVYTKKALWIRASENLFLELNKKYKENRCKK